MAATVRKRTTGKRDKFGNPVVSYQVRWREPVRDEFGAPTGKLKQTSETFPTERKAKAHARKVDNQLDTAAGISPTTTKAKANAPLGHYAQQYLDGLAGTVDPSTIQGYRDIYRRHIGPVFGSTPVAAITTADVARFKANLLAPFARHQAPKGVQRMVTRSSATIKHIIGTLRRILDTAVDDQAIAANPVVKGRRTTTKRRATHDGKKPFKHRPLSANQVAAVFDWIATDHVMVRAEANSSGPKGSTYTRQGNAVYALAVLFAAHTGVRASELQGLQVGDVTLSDIPGTVGSIRVARTAMRKGNVWQYGTPKSESSTDRVVPLASWLADEMRDYLSRIHPFSATNTQGGKYYPNAPLFPGRRNRYVFDWAKPVCAANLYENYLAPACKALGLQRQLGGTVRFHDLRHTFATMNLSAGEHYMQVSKWLGHSTFVLTLTTYADYINEDETAAPKVGRGIVAIADNVVELPQAATKRKRNA